MSSSRAGALELPQFTTPEELAGHTGCSERKLREIARKIGACRIIGNRMFLTQADVDAILEASRPCPANDLASSVEEKSGTIEARLPGDAYGALQAMLTKAKLSNSSRSRKQKSGTVIPLARSQP